MACGVKSGGQGSGVKLAYTVTGNFADHLQRAAVVVAPCALAMEDLFGMSLFESVSMPPGNGLCVNGEMYRKPKST
jgi:hypothetical protein